MGVVERGPAEDVAAVRNIMDEYGASLMAGDPDRYMGLWHENGYQLNPGGPLNEGAAAIRAMTSRDITENHFHEAVVSPREIIVTGERTAYSWGTFRFHFRRAATGEEVLKNGMYLTELVKTSDGSWKIRVDCYNME